MSHLDLLIIGFDHNLFVEVVLDSISKHKQIRVDLLEFCRGGGMFIFFIVLEALVVFLFDLAFEPAFNLSYIRLNCSI